MPSKIEQALYGYNNGHRVLASSMPLAGEEGRTLRSVTDMAFDGVSESYVTSTPLPDVRRHAVIKTWPAPEASRPGSVWSHVLLVDFVDLGALGTLWPLTRLFRRPQIRSKGNGNFTAYQKSLSFPAAEPRAGGHELDPADRIRVLLAAYGDESHRALRVIHPEEFEPLLFEVWSQQWPRLRRSFSFRTRYRVGSKASAFDVQLVERLQRDQEDAETPSELPPWVARLDLDLRRPSQDFRGFLRQFGAESDGRRDLPKLVDIKSALEREADSVVVMRAVCGSFSSVDEMPTLKQALFGRPDESSVGETSEVSRLRAVMQGTPASAIDLEFLGVAERLEALWSRNRTAAVRMVADLPTYEPANRRAVRMLIDSAVQNVTGGDVAAIAASDGGVAIALISKRHDLLAEPALWEVGPEFTPQLFEMLADSEPTLRRQILIELLKNGSVDAASELIRQDPTAWWLALEWGARAVSQRRSLGKVSSTLGRLLEAAGPASIGSVPADLSDEALILLAISAPPDTGLWRQVSANEWRGVAPSLAAVSDKKLRGRAMVVILAATRLAGSAGLRRDLWLRGFGPLHELLEAEAVDNEDVTLLDDLLPRDEKGDLSMRLRKAVVRQIGADRWPIEDVEVVMAAAGSHRQSMLDELRRKGKRKKSWWRDAFDQMARD